VIGNISPMALYRLLCALGQHSLVTVLTRCRLPLPVYILADEKHSRCLTDKVSLPTIVSKRVIWHLGYSASKSAVAFTTPYSEFQRTALEHEPSYRVQGALTDGFDSTTSSMRTLFPGARLGNCLRHALNKLPKKLMAIASPMRKALRSQFHTLWYRARQRKGLRVFALGQRLRHCADHVAATAGSANGARVRREFFVGDEPGGERHLGAQAPAHLWTDTECVAILHGHDRTPPPLSPSRGVGHRTAEPEAPRSRGPGAAASDTGRPWQAPPWQGLRADARLGGVDRQCTRAVA
jgi:hypothetical protein